MTSRADPKIDHVETPIVIQKVARPRLWFLFCLRVFISRLYENRSIRMAKIIVAFPGVSCPDPCPVLGGTRDWKATYFSTPC